MIAIFLYPKWWDSEGSLSDGKGRCGLGEPTLTRQQPDLTQRETAVSHRSPWQHLSLSLPGYAWHGCQSDAGTGDGHTWSAQISREMGCLNTLTKSDTRTEIQLWLLHFMDVTNGKADALLRCKLRGRTVQFEFISLFLFETRRS